MKKSTPNIIIVSTLLLILTAISTRNSLLDQIIDKLNQYYISNAIEKVYLHTDRPYYFANEHIYFKPYLTNNQNSILSKRQILYVELINGKNEAILQSKFKYDSDNNIGGSLHIPDTIKTGNYQLVAYTNWMKNYHEEFFFSKSIIIYDNESEIETISDQKKTKISLSFYPEGGHLVDGITSKIGFKAVDEYGKGININGKVLNSKNEEVAIFKTLHVGIGSFIMRPDISEKYRVVTENSDNLSFNFPSIKKEGDVLQVNTSNSEYIKTIVQTNSQNNNGYLLVAQAGNKIYYSVESKPTKKGFVANIPKERLPSGVIQITLFNDTGIPLCERLIFKKVDKQSRLNIKKEQPSNKIRDKVKLQIEASSTTNLSISVGTRQSEKYSKNIYSYLLLDSELKGEIESPGFYFDKENVNSSIALDNLLLTHGWRRFTWKEIFENHSKPKLYQVESDLVIKGKVYDLEKNLIPDREISISIPEELSSYEAMTDSLGSISAFVFDYFGSKQLIIQSIKENKETVFVPNHGFYDRKSNNNYKSQKTIIKDEKLLLEIENQKINDAFDMNHNKVKAPNNRSIIELTDNNYSKLYDRETKLSEYISFPTMREVFREIVTGVFVPFSENDLRVYSKDNQANFSDVPLYMVDGIPTFNTKYVLSLNPAEIETIGIISSKKSVSQFGYVGKNGVIAINSKSQKVAANIPADNTFVTYKGYSIVTEYYSATYEKNKLVDDRIPDLRSLIYWNPDVNISSNGMAKIEFYSSDQAGMYEVVVEGLTTDNKPIFGSTTILIE